MQFFSLIQECLCASAVHFSCLNVLQFFESACYQMLNYLVTHLKATDAPKVAGTSALHDTATVMCHTVAMPAVAGSPASKA